MKLLVDENLSARVAAMLRDGGHDAVHVTAVGLGSTDDEVILRAAAHDGSIVVTADADFGTLLALRGDRHPSVLMLRSSDHLTPQQQAQLIIAALERIRTELDEGAVASVTPERIRLRLLPITPEDSSG
jgi:predicted nuclease of predicted toxin-antitoxin system